MVYDGHCGRLVTARCLWGRGFKSTSGYHSNVLCGRYMVSTMRAVRIVYTFSTPKKWGERHHQPLYFRVALAWLSVCYTQCLAHSFCLSFMAGRENAFYVGTPRPYSFYLFGRGMFFHKGVSLESRGCSSFKPMPQKSPVSEARR